MGDFRKLKVWQEAHQLVLAIYRVTADFPSAEAYGLTSQLRRAAASIPANLAEGSGRRGDAEFARFCRIALGSASEVQYHLLLARDLDYLSLECHSDLDDRVDHIMRMLTRLVSKLGRTA